MRKAAQAAKKICDVYGHDAVSVRVAQSWFKRFQSGNFDVKDAPRFGRPINLEKSKSWKSWKKLSTADQLVFMISIRN